MKDILQSKKFYYLFVKKKKLKKPSGPTDHGGWTQQHSENDHERWTRVSSHTRLGLSPSPPTPQNVSQRHSSQLDHFCEDKRINSLYVVLSTDSTRHVRFTRLPTFRSPYPRPHLVPIFSVNYKSLSCDHV